jgi:membrane fusion protein, multidrug efflux system
MIKRFLIALLILGVLIGGLAYFQLVFKPAMIKGFLSKQVPPAATITAEAAQTNDWIERLPAIGTLIASQGVDVASQVAGIVTNLGFESGEDVPDGKKLVQLDVSVEMADLASADATQREADVAYKRQTDLLRKSVASEANVDTALAKRDTAAAAVNRIKALIAQKSILAPFAGRLGIRKVELGQYVSPGLALVTLQALDPIWVDFPMPEQNIGKLRVDQKIELTVDAFPNEVFEGKVTSLDARVAQDTRTLLVRGTLPNPDRKLLPGMFANVAVLAGAPAKVVTVPRTAVTYSLYGDSVYVVKPPEAKDAAKDGAEAATKDSAAPASSANEDIFAVERRYVVTGQVRGDRVAIASGVTAGEQVVTTGQLKLNNGSRVKIDNSQELKPPAELPKQ